MVRHALLVLGASMLAACSGRADEFDRRYLSAPLQARAGYGLADGDAPLPPGISLDNGVTEEEAVAIALWRNPDFAEALADLGFRRADIVQAGLLPNPVLSILFPLGPKQLEFSAKLPLEALWLRPARLAIAEADAERAASLLLQGGLDLVRDVRRTFAAWELTGRRVASSELLVAARGQLEQIARARLDAGDVSEQDVLGTRADFLRARSFAAQEVVSRDLLRERLRAMLGFARDATAFAFVSGGRTSGPLRGDRASRYQEALASRPDVRAAEYAIEAAGERAGLARWEFLAISGILDANNEGSKGFEAGPGVELPVPLLNQGGGARTRAEAEVERAARHYVAIRDRVALEMREGEARHARALASVQEAGEEREVAAEAVGASMRAEKAGDVSMRVVWEARLRLQEAQIREDEAKAGLRTALAELERAVGSRLE